MCHLFASQAPDSYAFETRSIRLNGQSTSIRLESIFWSILEEIAAREGLSVPRNPARSRRRAEFGCGSRFFILISLFASVG